jgi:hypothetical protein
MKAAVSQSVKLKGRTTAKNQALPPPTTSKRPSYGLPAQVGNVPDAASSNVTNYTSYPYRTTGKVFFQYWGSGQWKDSACSANVVAAENRATVITAGHCVFGHDPNKDSGAQVWDRNWIFIPGYHRNPSTGQQYRPYGTWSAKKLYSTNQWVNGRTNNTNWWNYDEGAVVVWPNSNGNVETRVGSRSITWNQQYNQYYRSFGYPGYYGCCLKEADSWYQGYDPNTSGHGPVTLWINSDLAGGSSGGAWVVGGSAGYVDGLNSYSYGSSPRMYSPYFGNVLGQLYNYVRNR